MTTQLPRRAVILARISDARNGDERGVTGQVADARALAERLGWGVGPEDTHVVVENDTSAFQRKKIRLPDGRSELRTVRPGFRRVLAMLTSREADGLIALDLDRACRDPRDLEDLVDVVESRRPRLPVESVTGSLRLASDADVTMARVLVAVANKSSRDTGRRVARARLEKAQAGGYGGGRRAYGYAADGLTVIEEEAAEIRKMADAILAGVSLRAVTADLRERGVPSVRGGQWDSITVRDVLMKPRNAGLAVHQVREAARGYRERGEPVPVDCGVVGPASWPGILPEETWRAVADFLSDPARRTSPGNTPRWLGSLIYQCGICNDGETVSISGGSVNTTRRAPSYVCRGQSHLRRAAGPVDSYVAEVVKRRLARSDAAALVARPGTQVDRVGLMKDLNTQQAAAGRVVRLVSTGVFTEVQAREEMTAINDRIAAIKSELAKTEERSPLDGLPLGSPDMAGVWDGLPLGARRAILRLLVDVTLTRGKPGRYADGRYFHPESVIIEWKR